MAKIEFNGNTFEYDPKFVTSYKVMKSLSTASVDPKRLFDALDIIFMGRADDYAEKLEDNTDEVMSLVNAIIEKDQKAKN